MDTIAAIATAKGIGGIAVIRMSGEKAFVIAEDTLGKTLSRPLQFCSIADLDDVVVSRFVAPHSFTGEDTIEISCHGSRYIQEELLRRLIDHGARMAGPGEFTRRAFLNGKMDLTQAEAVADLIAAQSRTEQHLALSHLRGGISECLKRLREQLLQLTSLLELELDFADHEELEFADRSQLMQAANEISREVSRLLASFKTGNAIRNGIKVAIVGATNAGKSTLLNALLGEERAIVSNIAGTTRDTVEDTLTIDGLLFRLIDTAGLRETNDPIEQLGIQRSKQAIQQADLILQVADINLPESAERIDSRAHVIRVLNKVDLLSEKQRIARKQTSDQDTVFIAAAKGEIEELRQRMLQVAQEQMGETDGVIISSVRHYEALSRAQEAILRVQQGLQDGLSGELLAMDLHDCLDALREITGSISSEDVLHNIFRHFCIGK